MNRSYQLTWRQQPIRTQRDGPTGRRLLGLFEWVTVEVLSFRLCGFEPFFDPRGDQYMYSRILNCDYEFVSPWWDEVSLNAKDLVSPTVPKDLSPLSRPFVPGVTLSCPGPWSGQ